MNYENKYKKAFELARDYYEDKNCFEYLKGVLKNIFPELQESEDEIIIPFGAKDSELIECTYYIPDGMEAIVDGDKVIIKRKESEDEKIRKEIISALKYANHEGVYNKHLDWLEKQGDTFKPSIRERYDRIKDSEWFKKTHEGMSVSDEEPKFHEGDWVVNDTTLNLCHILKVKHGQYICDDCSFPITKENEYHLWTIDDAKEGDALVASDGSLFIFAKVKDNSAHYHFSLCKNGSKEISDGNHSWETANSCHPATKEQRDTLFAKMRETGYEWDAEKKELKKIEEEINGEDYGIDSLYHAQRILEKTLGKVDGYQSDDGILEHKCAISAVKKLYEQKSAWSEEDDCYMSECISAIATKDGWTFEEKRKTKHWIKSLKDRVQPRLQPTWSEEDEKMVKDIIAAIDTLYYHGMVNWLKSLKERYTWKPSKEQIKAIRLARSFVVDDFGEHPTLSEILMELEEQLQKIKENKQ